MSVIPSFVPGKELIDGSDLQSMVSLTLNANPGLTAHAGGGQAGAVALEYGINEVSVVATTADSVVLPPAFAGTWVAVINTAANSVAVFASVTPLPSGSARTDTITPNNSVTPTASGTATSLATAKVAIFFCFKDTQWKELLTA